MQILHIKILKRSLNEERIKTITYQIVQRNFHMGLSPHHVLIFCRWEGFVSDKRQNMRKLEGSKNSTYHKNGENLWNVNGNVNRIVWEKIEIKNTAVHECCLLPMAN